MKIIDGPKAGQETDKADPTVYFLEPVPAGCEIVIYDPDYKVPAIMSNCKKYMYVLTEGYKGYGYYYACCV